MNRTTGKRGAVALGFGRVIDAALYINTHTHTPYCCRRRRRRMSKDPVDDSITPHRGSYSINYSDDDVCITIARRRN